MNPDPCGCAGLGYSIHPTTRKPVACKKPCPFAPRWLAYRVLTPAQLKCIDDTASHGQPWYSCQGKSQHGGRVQVVNSLVRSGLLITPYTNPRLTVKGWEIVVYYRNAARTKEASHA